MATTIFRRLGLYGLFPALVFSSLFFLTLFLLPLLVDIERHLPFLEQRLTALTGRPVAIDGELELALFPTLSLSLSGLRVGKPDDLSGRDLLRLDSLEAQLKPLPLLRGEIQLARLVANGLRLNLAAETPPLSSSLLDWLSSWQVTVATLAVVDGTVRLLDRQQREFLLEEVVLMVYDASLNRPLQGEFQGEIDGIALALAGELSPLRPVAAKSVPTFSGVVRLAGSPFNIQLTRNQQPASIDCRLGADRLNLDQLSPLLAAGQRLATVPASWWPEFSLTGELEIGELAIAGGLCRNLRGQLHWDEEGIRLDPLSCSLYDGELVAGLILGADDTSQLNLTLGEVQAGPLLAAMTGNDPVRGTLSGEGSFGGSSGLSSSGGAVALSGEMQLLVQQGSLAGGGVAGVPPESPVDGADEADRPSFTELRTTVVATGGDWHFTTATLAVPVGGMPQPPLMELFGRSIALRPQPWREVAETIASRAEAVAAGSLRSLVDGQLPSPVGEDVKDLVGRPLIDLIIVAERFGLQPEILPDEEGARRPGSGRVRINSLRWAESRD